MFFADEQNTKVLGAFLKKAEAAHVDDDKRMHRLKTSKEIVQYIYRSPEGWDEKCAFNIKHIGDKFLQILRGFDPTKSSNIDDIYVMAYRFLCEFDFLVGAGKELIMELRSIKRKIQEDTDEMGENNRSQIIYASFIMPANITKEIINDPNIGLFGDFDKKKNEAKTLKEQWDKEISEKQDKVVSLQESLDKYKTAFNFVGLYKGFFDLSTKKKRELFWNFWCMIAMGICLVVPLSIKTILTYIDIYNGNQFGIDKLLAFIPLLSVEVILIYFFRIILLNYRSVKAQIIQLELRQTLCQFIQSYAEYSTEIKKKDSVALEKFENLIFSGVLADPEKLPSTFDGLEQLVDLIKGIKGT